MAKKEENEVLGGFSALTNMLTANKDVVIPEINPEDIPGLGSEEDTPKGAGVTKFTEKSGEVDNTEIPDDIKKLIDKSTGPKIKHVESIKDFGDKEEDNDIPVVAKPKPATVKTKVKSVEKEEPIEDEEEVVETPTKEGETDDLGEYESDITDFVVDKLSEELNWNLSVEERPKDIKSTVELIKRVVDENSVPNYANDQVKQLDDYVRAGGTYEEFYNSTALGRMPIDSVDLEKDTHQKNILIEDLKNKGVKEAQIEKKIQRWEEAGVLKDEAEEALESVKEYREDLAQTLLENQKNRQVEVQKKQQNFLSNVDKTISNMKDILGLPFSDKEKRETLEYMLRPDASGRTGFFNDTGMFITYDSNPLKVIQSAYLAKRGDAFTKNLERKAESNTAKTLKQKLAATKTRGVDQGQEGERSMQSELLGSMSSLLLPRK